MPTIKIALKVELFYLQKWSGDWIRIYFVVTSVCVFRFVYTLPVRRNSEVEKMSSDSESNSFTNLSSSSDEDVMEEEEEDVEEIHGQITPYEDEPLADSEAAAGTEENEETDLDGLTPAVLEARYEREIAVSSWLV